MINLNLNNFSTYVERVNTGVISPILVEVTKKINGEDKTINQLIVISDKGLNFISASFLSFGYENEKSVAMLPTSNKSNLTTLVNEYFTNIQYKNCMRKSKEGVWSSSLYPYFTLEKRPENLKGAKLFGYLEKFAREYGIDWEALNTHINSERKLKEFFEIAG